MKKTLAILGAGVVVGAVAYAIWNKIQKERDFAANDSVNKDDNGHEEDTFASVHKNIVEEEAIVEKSIKMHDMSVRHEEATQIMKDAVEIICNRSKVEENENEELDQISSGLDDLLRED